MDATEFAAVVVAITSVVAVTLLVVGLVMLSRTLRSISDAVDDLRRETVPVVLNLQEASGRATADLTRLEELLGTAESISATVDSASRLAYLTFSNPVIKAMALGTGTHRAYRRLRRGS